MIQYRCYSVGVSPRFVCLGISATDSHQTSDFCECLQLFIDKGDIALAYEISPMYRESLSGKKL
jgi:hypothetical protein